jgi:hypothetical protein
MVQGLPAYLGRFDEYPEILNDSILPCKIADMRGPDVVFKIPVGEIQVILIPV